METQLGHATFALNDTEGRLRSAETQLEQLRRSTTAVLTYTQRELASVGGNVRSAADLDRPSGDNGHTSGTDPASVTKDGNWPSWLRAINLSTSEAEDQDAEEGEEEDPGQNEDSYSEGELPEEIRVYKFLPETHG
jgi:hypothetical protein